MIQFALQQQSSTTRKHAGAMVRAHAAVMQAHKTAKTMVPTNIKFQSPSTMEHGAARAGQAAVVKTLNTIRLLDEIHGLRVPIA